MCYLQVIKATANSMNNRFLPYDVIETEAIFLMDDDLVLTKSQILSLF